MTVRRTAVVLAVAAALAAPAAAQAATVAPAASTTAATTAATSAAPVSQMPVLRTGARGDLVKTVQRTLAEMGHPVAVDGAFGAGTATAVKRVQARNGLPQTGVIDARTWSALGIQYTGMWIGSPTLRQGDRSAAVRRLQMQLEDQRRINPRMGGPRVVADGSFGAGTRDAVVRLQKAAGLRVTGVADLAVWYAAGNGFGC